MVGVGPGTGRDPARAAMENGTTTRADGPPEFPVEDATVSRYLPGGAWLVHGEPPPVPGCSTWTQVPVALAVVPGPRWIGDIRTHM